MKMLLWFLPLLALIGCTTKGEPLESGSYCQVTKDNVLTYGPAVVKVNPSFEYAKKSKRQKVLAEGVSDANLKAEYHMFAERDSNKFVLIITQTVRNPHTFWRHDMNLFRETTAIDKGKIEIDNKHFYYCINYSDKFPIEKFKCGLFKGVSRVLNRFKCITVYYFEGLYDCDGLSNDSNLISDPQRKSVQEFEDRFNENITITHQ
jgi:hypothetical protein